MLLEYEDHLPLTVRQIFYRLVGRFGYPKDEKASERLGEKLLRARRARMIPFNAIRDDGIVSYSPEFFADPADFWDATAEKIHGYLRDRQASQRQYIELWCESAGMAPQLARVATAYSVPVFSSGGFNSLTAVRQVADRVLARDVSTVMLHVGDFDPAGESIFESLAADAAAFVREDRVILTQHLEPLRVALTAEQVEDYNLPTAPTKPDDTRAKRWKGQTCQLEALAPDVLAALVREAIEFFMDMERVGQVVEAERLDRNDLLRALPRGAEVDDGASR